MNDEVYLMTITTAQIEGSSSDDAAEELTWANLEIQKAQRQISRGVSELAEGVVSLSLVLLDVRRRRLYRFDPDYPTFEAFVERRHGISAQTAHQYVEALSSLGEMQYRALISDLGVQRTYALAMLQKTDPALVTAFQALPTDERQAVMVAQIEAVDDAATAELCAKVAELEHEITRERGLHQQSRKRLQEAEDLHQRVSGSLIEERDTARQALDQEQEQTERLRALLAETKRQSSVATPAQPAPARPMLPAAQTDTPHTMDVTVVVPYNIADLVSQVHTLAEKLTHLAQVGRDTIPFEQRRALAAALQRLERTVGEVLRGS